MAGIVMARAIALVTFIIYPVVFDGESAAPACDTVRLGPNVVRQNDARGSMRQGS